MKLKLWLNKVNGDYELMMESSSVSYWFVALFTAKGTFHMFPAIDEDFLPEGRFTPLLEEEEPEFDPVYIIKELPRMYLEEDEHTGDVIVKMESHVPNGQDWNVMVLDANGHYDLCTNIDEPFLPNGYFVRERTFTPLLEEEEPEFDPVDIIKELPGMYLEEDEHTGDVIVKMESNVPNGQDWNVMVFDSQGHYDLCTNIDEPFLPNGYFVRERTFTL